MIWIRVGSISLFLAVAIGAFAAHGLKSKLSEYAMGIIETGVRYQFYHGLGLLFLGWFSSTHSGNLTTTAGTSFIAGTILFSGSLYALALTGTKTWGAITPLGGLLFLIGWTCLFLKTFSK